MPAATSATTKKSKTSHKPHPPKKSKYGVCSEWNTPGDSHHLILHLRIQPSARNRPKAAATAATAAATVSAPAFPEEGVETATFNELLQYRPELNLPPEAYEHLGSDSYPYRFEGATAATAAAAAADGGAPATAVVGEALRTVTGSGLVAEGAALAQPAAAHAQVAYDDTGRRLSTAPSPSSGASPSAARGANARTPGHVHGRIVPVPSSVQRNATETTTVAPPPNDGTAASTTVSPTLESVHHPVLHCWWCTCAFQWTPYAVPIARERKTNKYETTGTFCSPECCAAYIFGGNTRCGGGRQTVGGDPWKQYEMLHRMVTKMVTKVTVRIKLAPPRETLQKFGGPYTVPEYRRILNDYRVDVRITMPPVNPLNGVTEEIPVDYVQQKKKFVPIDSSRVEKATNELRLKRKKKQAEENTLETFMQLRIS